MSDIIRFSGDEGVGMEISKNTNGYVKIVDVYERTFYVDPESLSEILEEQAGEMNSGVSVEHW